MTYWIWDNLGTCSITEYTEEGAIIVDVRDLQDGPENVGKIKRKIEMVLGLLGTGHKVIIRCIAGMSRSNAIATAVISIIWHKTFAEAEMYVKNKCPRCQINMDFADCVKQAIKLLKFERE